MKNIPVIVAIVVAALTFIPSPKKAEGPVATAMAGASRSDRSHLKGIYLSLADVTEKDNGNLISTVGMWRQLHINTLKLAAADMRGKYAGLDVAVEKVMADKFPLDDAPLSPSLVNQIAAACREVAKQSE
jgi:hypothetical protein